MEEREFSFPRLSINNSSNGTKPICSYKEVEGAMEDKRLCQECKKPVDKNDLQWVNDNYGIPYKCVCEDCYEEVEAHIRGWEYDYLDAGEYLD